MPALSSGNNMQQYTHFFSNRLLNYSYMKNASSQVWFILHTTIDLYHLMEDKTSAFSTNLNS